VIILYKRPYGIISHKTEMSTDCIASLMIKHIVFIFSPVSCDNLVLSLFLLFPSFM